MTGYYELVWFTDGSKTEHGVGAAAYSKSITTPLGKLASVFQAEILAINCCALTLIINGIMGTSIAICSDSAAAIKSLSKPEIRNKTV